MQRHTSQRRIPHQPASPPSYRRNRKRKNWGPILKRWLVVLAAAALAAFLLTNHRFEIRDVRFIGNRTIPASELALLVPLPYRQNIFLYVIAHHGRIARDVEQGEPAVLEAHVRPGLPHTLVVRIAERSGYVQLRQNHGALWLVDRLGVPYRMLPGRKPDLTAVVVPLESVNPVLGKPLPTTSNSPLGVAFEALDVLRDTGTFAPGQVKDIRVDQSLNLCLNTDNNLLIKLGQPADLATKMAKAAAIMSNDSQQANAAAYVDVSEPDHPALMPRPGAGGVNGSPN